MTTGLDAGPYGDPMRFPPMTKWRDPVQGVTYDAYMHGTNQYLPCLRKTQANYCYFTFV